MKVRDVIEKLSRANSEAELLCSCEDEGVVPPGGGSRIFAMTGLDEIQAEMMRRPDGTPYLELGSTPDAIAHVLVTITTNF